MLTLFWNFNVIMSSLPSDSNFLSVWNRIPDELHQLFSSEFKIDTTGLYIHVGTYMWELCVWKWMKFTWLYLCRYISTISTLGIVYFKCIEIIDIASSYLQFEVDWSHSILNLIIILFNIVYLLRVLKTVMLTSIVNHRHVRWVPTTLPSVYPRLITLSLLYERFGQKKLSNLGNRSFESAQ